MTGFRDATYIERIASAIYQRCEQKWPYPQSEAALWLGYAMLALAKGEETTSEDVHDAWSAWATVHHNGEHRSLVPFDQLSAEVQAYDDLYRDAIHWVVREGLTGALA